jgi:hypothetical protein
LSLWFRPPWSEKFHMARVNPPNRILMSRLPGFSLFDSGRPSSVRGYFIFVGPLSGYGSLFLPVDTYAHSSDRLRLRLCAPSHSPLLFTRANFTLHTHQTLVLKLFTLIPKLYTHTNISFLTFHTDANHSFLKLFTLCRSEQRPEETSRAMD